jgi:protein tyrosine/serine phosphatase
MLVLALSAAVIGFRRPLFQGNLGVVDPARAYRSAQPSSELEATIRKLGLRSIIDLRGGSESDVFYSNEVETTGRLGVDFYDIPMSASRRPSRRDLIRMVDVIDHARTPLLIHCKWGADRTGLMSALYQLVVLGEPPEKAIHAFSLSYGHFPLFGPERLHEPIDEYARWLREHGLEHNPQRFRDWLANDYRSDDPYKAWPIVRPGPRQRNSPELKANAN